MIDNNNPLPGRNGYSTPPKKNKIWYQQSFNAEWRKNPKLKDCVKRPKYKCAAACSVCDKLKISSKSSLMQHKAFVKHLESHNAKRSVSGIQSYLKKKIKTTEDDLDDKVSKPELLLTGYVAEHVSQL